MSALTLILAGWVALAALMTAILAYAADHAPHGYEDDEGFHELRARRDTRPAPSPIDVRPRRAP